MLIPARVAAFSRLHVRTFVLGLSVLLGFLPGAPPTAAAFGSGFDFALIGDMPYTPEDEVRFERLVRDVNGHRPRVEWVLHVGDLRGGGKSPCSNEVLAGRFARMQRFAEPFVLTPGDNDYLDCRKTDPHERLAYLRGLFFPDPDRTTGGKSMRVESQSRRAGFEPFVENVMWEKKGVLFATIHALGVDRMPDPHPDLTAARNAAAIAWIEAVFARARELGSPGVFLATQADPWMVTGPPAVARRVCRGAPESESPCLAKRGGIEPLYDALENAVTAFGKPVVLATGDLHYFRVDKPLLVERTRGDEDPRTLENFTRVEAFGSPYIHWVRIGVDPRDRDVFSFHPEVIPENQLGGAGER
ncbi:MAG: hypothetical protein IPK00_06680 [Deltaproteobacteria bacterium]|nr:hypothetical protein [Deltaproteobacteria bacterium]